MLNNIRSLAEHTITRIFLAFIAISFVVWGVKGVLQGVNNHEIVSFSKAKNITEVDFLRAKAREVKDIEQNNGAILSEEEIKNLQIDSIVLKRMITENIINYISEFYNLDISDGLVIENIKNSKSFKNKKGDFDLNIFNANLRTASQKQEYLSSVKENILNNVLLSIFLESFTPPQILVENIITYLSETRMVDVVSLDLNIINKHYISHRPSEQELEEFYKKNQNLFTLPETRNLTYLEIFYMDLVEKINVNEEELSTYYNENSAEFKGKQIATVKSRITKLLKNQKLEKFIFEFIKNLEEEVASGSSLKEIENKYGGKINIAINQSYDEIIKNNKLSSLAENIFEMSEAEVSYPIELSQQKKIILIEINKITTGTLEKFKDIEAKVLDLWHQNEVIAVNIKNFTNLAKNYKTADLTLQDIKNGLPVKIENISITRADLDNNKLPTELLFLIFEQGVGNNTQIVRLQDKIYFAHVKSVNINNKKFKEITKTASKNIITTLKNSVMEELIDYFIKENNMKISHQITNNK